MYMLASSFHTSKIHVYDYQTTNFFGSPHFLEYTRLNTFATLNKNLKKLLPRTGSLVSLKKMHTAMFCTTMCFEIYCKLVYGT